MQLRDKLLLTVLAGCGTGLAVRIAYEVYKTHIEVINNMLAAQEAYDIMAAKISANEYLGDNLNNVETDFEFYRIAARLKKD